MGSEKIIKQNGFSFNLGKSSQQITTASDTFSRMRDWQIEAFNQLKDAHSMILNAPMGSGKSWLMCLLSAFKMKKNQALRTIISVPQTTIAPGFVSASLIMPDGEKLEWNVGNNLCKADSRQSKASSGIQWLIKPSDTLSDKVLLCTHTTLVAIYKKLKQEGKLDLLSNLLIWIDEAHHVMNAAVKDLEGPVINNELGKLVEYIMNNPQIKLGLTTASFFRGDRCSLLTETMEKQFQRYHLPYDKYLKSMKYLRSFSYDFLMCGYDYTKGIETIIKERKGKDIIYIPHAVSRYSTGNKSKEVSDIINKYQSIHGEDVSHSKEGIIHLNSENGSFKILDLVDEHPRRRSLRKGYIETLKQNPKNLDAIIAMGMFKEGADWVCADRSIIVGPRASLVDVVQIVGRLFRDYEGKEHVEVIQLLPVSFDQQKQDFKENLNNFLKAIFASMILEDILNPAKIKMPFKIENKKKSEKSSTSEGRSLAELVPDETTRLELLEEATLCLAEITAQYEKEKLTIPELYEEFHKAFSSLLANYPLDTSEREVSDRILNVILRRHPKLQGLDVENIDFDILKEIHPLEGLLKYTSGACGIETFEQLRAAIQACRSPLPLNLVLDWARKFNEKYGRKPRKKDGIVEFAKGEYQGITWNAINTASIRGHRGLPKGLSLADLMKMEFGIKNPKNTPTLTEAEIKELIKRFIELHGRKPQATDGQVESIEDITWENIDRRLRDGQCGLPGGSSLSMFIEQHFGIRDQVNVPEIPLTLIHNWVQSHLDKYKSKPIAKSGKVDFARGAYQNISWHSVNQALKAGKCGLPVGTTLSSFIQFEFGIKNPKRAEPIPEEKVVLWIQKFIEKNNRKPKVNDGVIEFAEDQFSGLKWRLLNNYLSKGGRGFPGGSSLAKLIEKKIRYQNSL